MSLTLTVLLSLISAAILAGRVYEILNLTDAATGFLLVGGVVLNPYILVLVAVITLCCGIIIFGKYKVVAPYYSKSSKYTALIAGVAMAAAGALALTTEVTAPFFIAGGVAFIVLAVAGLGRRKSDYLVMILLFVFVAGMCMDVVTFDVFTYHNTQFLTKVLSYICMTAFILVVLRNVYMPAKFSRMMIYVVGMLSFAVCSMMSLADIISYIITDGQSLAYLLTKISVALFGVYAFDNAVSAIPDKKELKKAEKAAVSEIAAAEKSETVAETAQTDVSAMQENTAHTVETADNALNSEDIFASTELAQIFDALAEEKSAPAQQETPVFRAEEFVLQENADEKAQKHEMFTELFGTDTKTEISVPQDDGIFSETRSFKKYAEPKLYETAPEYDMLKSMFRGEDTSQYEVPDADVKKEKKRSLFGGKKEKAAKEKTAAEKPEKTTAAVSENGENKAKNTFAVSQSKVQKSKTETKKVVYKKPK